MMIRTLMFLGAVALLASPAHGQTTQPTEKPQADQAWPLAVQALAKSLVAGELDDTQAMLLPQAQVRHFDGARTDELWRMSERAVKSTIVGQHAYSYPPLVMAADIAADFKNAAAIPDKVKADYIVDDEGDIKRANATAVQWLAEQLKAQKGAPVGVIVLWTPRTLPPGVKPISAEGSGFDVMFVLCRGQEMTGHKFKMTTVVYGSPASVDGR